MRLWIVRHGESEWNRIHRYQGQLDPALSELGIQQAEALAQRFRDEPVDAIYTSPLLRAAATAEAIAHYHPDLAVQPETALLEIHHGTWQGKYAHEIEAEYGPGLEEWRRHPMRSQMPDGESFSNVLQRTLAWKERMAQAHAGQSVLASTHDVVLKILVADALGMDMDRINCLWLTNASISTIDYSGELPYVLSLGEACHLGSLATRRENQQAL